jgi:hypothetical protein
MVTTGYQTQFDGERKRRRDFASTAAIYRVD